MPRGAGGIRSFVTRVPGVSELTGVSPGNQTGLFWKSSFFLFLTAEPSLQPRYSFSRCKTLHHFYMLTEIIWERAGCGGVGVWGYGYRAQIRVQQLRWPGKDGKEWGKTVGFLFPSFLLSGDRFLLASQGWP